MGSGSARRRPTCGGARGESRAGAALPQARYAAYRRSRIRRLRRVALARTTGSLRADGSAPRRSRPLGTGPPFRNCEQRNSAPYILIDLHAESLGCDRVGDVVGDPRGQALAERTFIAIGPEIELERLRFDAALRRRVLDDHAAEVRLAGLGTDRGELRRRQSHRLDVGGWEGFCLEVLARLGGIRGPGQRTGPRQPQFPLM